VSINYSTKNHLEKLH